MTTLDRRTLIAAAPAVAGAALLPAAGRTVAAPTGSLELIAPFRLQDSRMSEPDKYDASARDQLAVPDLAGKFGVLLNVTVAQTEGKGWFRIAGEFEDPPATSTINWSGDDQTIANMAIVAVTPPAAGVVVQGGGTGRAHLILDVLGYVV